MDEHFVPSFAEVLAFCIDKENDDVSDENLCFALLAADMLDDEEDDRRGDTEPKTKRPKQVFNRRWAWEFITSMSDDMFKKQYRVSREIFFDLVEKMKKAYPGSSPDGLTNYSLAQTRSSASSANKQPVTMELRLAITLRMLAGASYLDMCWYQVGMSTIHAIFLHTLRLLNVIMPNEEVFDLPKDEAEWEKIAEEWTDIMVRKRSHDLMPGTVLAGDGLVIQIKEPSDSDRGGLDVAAFRNRKGASLLYTSFVFVLEVVVV
jgi:hypothetical protein